ncbi:MAG TPA: hypothetical protein VN282_19120 [Pyrinomonadaceae bacterium]|nr:hypothetical protein [Pyrinomonadaceae bacterium]
MSEKITVLYVEQTGHVLAVLTRAADAEAEPVVEELAGEALPVRRFGLTTATWFPTVEFLVPASELKAKNVDLKPGVVENPRGFYLDENDELQPFDATTSVFSATLSGTQVTVTVAGATAIAAEADVLIHITDPNPANAQTQTAVKAAASTTVVVNISPLSAGTHHVLTLVAKVRPNAFQL